MVYDFAYVKAIFQTYLEDDKSNGGGGLKEYLGTVCWILTHTLIDMQTIPCCDIIDICIDTFLSEFYKNFTRIQVIRGHLG